MPAPVYIGDEVSAAGYRLAGLVTRTPAPDDIASTMRWAREHATLILIGSTVAERIPQAELDKLLAAVSPPAMIVPDVRERGEKANPGVRLRRMLGVLE